MHFGWGSDHPIWSSCSGCVGIPVLHPHVESTIDAYFFLQCTKHTKITTEMLCSSTEAPKGPNPNTSKPKPTSGTCRSNLEQRSRGFVGVSLGISVSLPSALPYQALLSCIVSNVSGSPNLRSPQPKLCDGILPQKLFYFEHPHPLLVEIL